MEQRTDDPLSRWLAAESDDRQQDAEAALAELMAGLPPLAPRAGFAGRVMLAVAWGPSPAMLPVRAGGLFASRWLQAALAFTLAAASLVAVLAPEVLGALLGLVSPGEVVTLGMRSLSEGMGLLGAGLDFLFHFETLGRAAALLLSAPEVMASLAGCALVSTISFYLLKSLLTNRSWPHVHPF